MRVYLEMCPNTEPVPFEYQHFLTGAFHQWLGENLMHDVISLYSLSWLTGSRHVEGALDFPHGAQWFISSPDNTIINDIIDSALIRPVVCCGMRVVKMRQQETPNFGSYCGFKVGSPVLARSQEVEGKVRHYLYSDQEADEVLTAALKHKMDKAHLDSRHKSVTVRFDRKYRNAKTKLVTIKGIHNRASVCPVIVEGTPEAVQFAWNVGVGHLTGSGFGCLL